MRVEPVGPTRLSRAAEQHAWFQRARHAPPGSAEGAFYVSSDTDRKFPYVDGETEHYVLPLALLAGAEAERVLSHTPGSVLARIAGARRGIVVDGWQDDDTCERLVALIQRAEQTATKRGHLHGFVMGAPLDLPAERTWVRDSSDQSHSVVLINDLYVLKLVRRVEPGPNPEFEIGRHFAEHGYARTPAIAGALEYDRPGMAPATLCLVQVAIKHQGSGWDYSIDDLGRYFERVAARVPVPGDGPARTIDPPPFFSALEHWYLSSAATLGRRTAEMHAALAAATDPAFAPEPLTHADLDRLADQMQMRAETSLGLLQERLGSLGDTTRLHAEAVLAARGTLVSRFDRIAGVDPAGLRMRIHGDYRLGHVLRTDEDFVIIDFDGEPARSRAERRARQSPLKDVAAMVRSFGYAAYAALLSFTVHTPDDHADLESWADEWQRWAAAAFLAAYRPAIATAAGAKNPAIVPADDQAFDALLTAFVVEKALEELTYELESRPDWVRIPLAGLLRLANDLPSRTLP